METIQDKLLPGGLASHGQCEGRGGGHLHHQLLRRGWTGEINFYSFLFFCSLNVKLKQFILLIILNLTLR